MQQVLEAPPIQDEVRKPSTIDDGDSVAEQTQSPVTRLRAIMSIFSKPRPPHLPVCVDPLAQSESALDRISRIDPYLYIRSLAG